MNKNNFIYNNFLKTKNTLFFWLITLDHKKIAILYFISIGFYFFMGGVFAILLRLELFQNRIHNATDTSYFITANQYNEIFTLHGAIMIFLVIIPLIPSTLGNFLLPLMIGAKDLAFPKLNLLGFYLYFIGSLFFISTLAFGGLDTGWTFYTPYSTETNTAVTMAVVGAFILGFSSVLNGINFIVTVHKMRAPGMTWFRLPLFVWAVYSTAIIQVLATPVLAVTLFLLAIERLLNVGIFDPTLGGDPILFQNFFWFYSHPAVYIMILPAFGIISELTTTHSQKSIFGYKAVAISSIAIAMFSFFVWGHHMFTSGQSAIASVTFSLLTYSVAVPTAIKVFSWVATLYKGSIHLCTPMFYVFSFLILFVIGGLTGIFLGALAVDVHIHNTYFLVAHFHYVMMGGALIAWLGGVHHWWPKITGKKYNDKVGILACILIFIGFNLTFFPQFIMGSRGMPRRSYDYLPEYQIFHDISTIGTIVLTIALLLAFINLMYSLIKGEDETKPNPWNSKTLEWQHNTVIPPVENFTTQPIVNSNPYEFNK